MIKSVLEDPEDVTTTAPAWKVRKVLQSGAGDARSIFKRGHRASGDLLAFSDAVSLRLLGESVERAYDIIYTSNI